MLNSVLTCAFYTGFYLMITVLQLWILCTYPKSLDFFQDYKGCLKKQISAGLIVLVILMTAIPYFLITEEAKPFVFEGMSFLMSFFGIICIAILLPESE